MSSEYEFFDSTPECTPRQEWSDTAAAAAAQQSKFFAQGLPCAVFSPAAVAGALTSSDCYQSKQVVHMIPVTAMGTVAHILPVLILQPMTHFDFSGLAYDAQTVHGVPVQRISTAVVPAKQCNMLNSVCRKAMMNHLEETAGPHAEKLRRSPSLPPGFKPDFCETCGKIRSGYRASNCRVHNNIKECIADPECKPCVFGGGLHFQSLRFCSGGCLHAQKGLCSRERHDSCNFCHCDAPLAHRKKPRRTAWKGQRKRASRRQMKSRRSHSAPAHFCTEEHHSTDYA